MNAKVLEEMEIGVFSHRKDRCLRRQGRELQVENRASRDAQIGLKMDEETILKHHDRTHDFSKADPFDKPGGRLIHMF